MRIGRIGSIAALSMAAAMAELSSRSLYGVRDEYGDRVNFVQVGRRNQAAQWKRETGQVKRKGRQ